MTARSVFPPRRLLVAFLVALSLSIAGCSSETAPTEKRGPTNKHLKYIEELTKKGTAPKGQPGKGR